MKHLSKSCEWSVHIMYYWPTAAETEGGRPNLLCKVCTTSRAQDTQPESPHNMAQQRTIKSTPNRWQLSTQIQRKSEQRKNTCREQVSFLNYQITQVTKVQREKDHEHGRLNFDWSHNDISTCHSQIFFGIFFKGPVPSKKGLLVHNISLTRYILRLIFSFKNDPLSYYITD